MHKNTPKPEVGVQSHQFDVIIVGGGLVGSALALALADQPIKIAVVEAKALAASVNPSHDRVLAISQSSSRIFQALQLWPQLAALVHPIAQVHVSDAGHFGSTQFSAVDYHLPALGYVIPAAKLLTILQQNLSNKPQISCYAPATLEHLQPMSQGYALTINAAQQPLHLTTQLLIVVDGSDSKTRAMLGIQAQQTDYQEQALLGTVTLAQPHQHVAYERFTKNGPLAFLPLADNQYAFIWTVNTEQASTLLQLPQPQFCQQLQQAFGYRLGRFQQAAATQSHKLRSIFAEQQIRPQMVLLGNAAHTLHPVAAQGLNLGLKDAAALAQLIVEAVQTNRPLHDYVILEKYMQWRQQEQKALKFFIDGLVQVFTAQTFPIPLVRDLGLCGLDTLPTAKKWLAKAGMGLNGRLPKLACGVAL